MGRTSNRNPYRPKPSLRSTKTGEAGGRQSFLIEAEVVDGLASFAREELTAKLGTQFRAVVSEPSITGSVQFHYSGDLHQLLTLKTVQAVYLVRNFDVPRPRALLGNEHFQNLQRDIATAIQLSPPDSYKTFYISAAGSDSSVMVRLKDELTQATGLINGEEEGDLLLRLRRDRTSGDWQSLVRLTPRPLATRSWRVCNFPGALNATVAYVMALLTEPKPEDVFLNLACGSGTFMIERLATGSAKIVMGCDISLDALECAQTNLLETRLTNRVRLSRGDAIRLPLAENSVSTLCADLPFGNLVGSHDANLVLYPALLDEAARVSRHGARFVLITHEIRLMQNLLEQQQWWVLETTIPITLTGLHPRIYVLVRK